MQQSMVSQSSAADGKLDHFISNFYPDGRVFISPYSNKIQKNYFFLFTTLLNFLFLFFKITKASRDTHIANNVPTMCFHCTQPLGLDDLGWTVPSGEYHFCEGLKQLRHHEGCKLPGAQSKSAHLVWMEKTLSSMRRITKSLSVMDLDHLHLDGKLSGEWTAFSLPVTAR